MEANNKRAIEVLVIDDEPIVGKSLRLALGKAGYTVEVFDDPVLALRRLGEKSFEIVVTDVVMGDVDGLQVLEQVMTNSPQSKVIIMTAFAQMSMARKAMEKGAFDFIAKPFDTQQIRDLVNKAADAVRADS
ncbi:MAG TPA: response regulator [Myxococcota bacterium]|nr:response regulator [Myxococcota bacterium]